MEIITYVLSGKLEHKDSLGTGSVILPGDGQRMTAGRGIRHSEANASSTEAVHLLQIWILPDKHGHEPGYEQKAFPESEKRGKFRLIASNDGAEGSVKINQDAKLFVTLLAPGEELTQSLGAKRFGWLQVAKGEIELNGQTLHPGDGAAISEEKALAIKATEEAEVLLFDLA
jgi:redox-sensitive bicupin YhaK (pirin superfamily)